jgi:DNA-binding response OmpR family regulator
VNIVQRHVLFSEDDPSTRQAVAKVFKEHNIPVCAVAGGHKFGRYFAGGSPSPIIIDLHLGQCGGRVPPREIRSPSDVPTVVTGSDRCDENDRVVALELRTDEYVTKPVSARELLARSGHVEATDVRAGSAYARFEAGRILSRRLPSTASVKRQAEHNVLMVAQGFNAGESEQHIT